MQQLTPGQKRYELELACGHKRRTEYPPLGGRYPCDECPAGAPSPAVVRYTDALRDVVTQLRMPTA